MRFYYVPWSLVLLACAATADPINAPSSIPPGNLYMAGSTPTQAEDSGVGANSISIGLTSNGDSDYTMASTDRVVQLSAQLTAPRVWTLPCASTFAGAQTLQIIDPGKYLSMHFLKILPASTGCSDTINNGAAMNVAQMTSPGSRAVAISDGTSNWSVTVVRQPTRTLDFAADFGGIQASAIGTTDCEVVGC